mgnify:CR=1 FL=1
MTAERGNACPIPTPIPAPPRRVSKTLPPYRYVPGLNPHPFRNPNGHMYTDGTAPDHAVWMPTDDWENDATLRYAADLFDHRFFWEAHEEWESVWHCCPLEGIDRPVLQSLIQLAASILQHHMGQRRSQTLLFERARRRMVEHQIVRHKGIAIADLLSATEAFFVTGVYPRLMFGRPT